MTFKFAAFIKVAHFWWILFFIYICWSPTYSTVNVHPTALSISPVWCHLSLVSSIVTAFITLKFKSGVFCIFLVSIPDRYLEQNYRPFQSDVLGRKLSENLMIRGLKAWPFELSLHGMWLYDGSLGSRQTFRKTIINSLSRKGNYISIPSFSSTLSVKIITPTLDIIPERRKLWHWWSFTNQRHKIYAPKLYTDKNYHTYVH